MSLPAFSWGRRLIEQWLGERTARMVADARRAEVGLSAAQAREYRPAEASDYQRARRVLVARLRAAAAIFEAPVTPEEWAGEAVAEAKDRAG